MYSWPLKPFDQAHPVRGYFNDLRISGTSRAFHFGTTFSAPNGTPAYAVRAGVVHLEGRRSLSVSDGDLDFGYRDPLRPGALSPWHDTTRPLVIRIVFSRNGRVLSPAAVSGAVDVIADAHQLPPLEVAAPWNGLPITPAQLRWRVRRGGRTARPWHTPVDFSKHLPHKEEFRRIYAPGTRQNRAGTPGLYRLFLAHTWSTTLFPDGPYHVEVEAIDLYGNTSSRQLAFTIANNV